MIGFTMRLLARSMRWVAPTAVLLSWIAIALTGNGTALVRASSMFPAPDLGAWTTIAAGNVDDDDHRDLLAAAVGGPARLHVARTIAVLVVAAPVIVALAVVAGGLVDQPTQPTAATIAAIGGLEVTAVLLGAGIGTLLHRPVSRHRAMQVLVAASACIGVMLLGPVATLHRALDDGRVAPVAIATIAAGAWAAIATTIAAHAAATRSR